MKTLTQDGVSHFIIDDNKYIEMLDDRINIGNPFAVVLTTYTAQNTILHENVTPPADWEGLKYLFNGTDWSLNPDFVPQQPGFPTEITWPVAPDA